MSGFFKQRQSSADSTLTPNVGQYGWTLYESQSVSQIIGYVNEAKGYAVEAANSANSARDSASLALVYVDQAKEWAGKSEISYQSSSDEADRSERYANQSVDIYNAFLNVAANQRIIETFDLAVDQTVVTFTKIMADAAFVSVNGQRIDSCYLVKDIDYTVTKVSEITLKRRYPVGTKLSAVQDIKKDDSVPGVSESAAVWNRKFINAQVGVVFADYNDNGREVTPRLVYQGGQYLPTYNSSESVTFTDVPVKQNNGDLLINTNNGQRRFSRTLAEAVSRFDVFDGTPFGDSVVGVYRRPGINYEVAGTVEKPENRVWYHDYRPLGTAQGGSALFSTDGANMFMGFGAGNFTMTPVNNSVLPAGKDYNLQCSHNIGFGIQALGQITIGYKNSGFGTNTLRKLTSGHGNSAFGRDAGHEITTGNECTYLGFAAGQLQNTGNYNTAGGAASGYNNTDGSGNSYFGRRAGFSNTAGNYNIFVGENAGWGFESGSYTTFIGKQAAATGITGGDSSLIIGHRLTNLSNEKEQVIIADGSGKPVIEVHKDPTAAVKLGSYIDIPSYNVTPFSATESGGQIDAGSTILLRSLGNAGNAVTQVVFQSRVNQKTSRIVSTGGTSAQMVFVNAEVERLRINTDGHLTPGVDNTQNLGSAGRKFGTVFAGTGAINTSDAREKTDAFIISDEVLDAWESVSLISFQWISALKEKGDDARWHFGVMAQAIRDAFLEKGLDGTRFGLLCYDEWEASESGPAGNRWGIRPDQCLFLEAAYQRRRCDRIEARLTKAGI